MPILYVYDPGGTTGWAEFGVQKSGKVAALVSSGEYELWHGVEKQIRKRSDLIVVYENIVPRHMDFNPIGLQVIGVIRFLCEQVGTVPTSQPNGVIRGVERWGLYDFDNIRSPHAKDAIMHGIVYLRKLGYTVQL